MRDLLTASNAFSLMLLLTMMGSGWLFLRRGSVQPTLAMLQMTVSSYKETLLLEQGKRRELDSRITAMADEHASEMLALQEELAALHHRVELLITEGVEKDSVIAGLLRKIRGLEAALKRMGVLRSQCPNPTCPIDRRSRTAARSSHDRGSEHDAP